MTEPEYPLKRMLDLWDTDLSAYRIAFIRHGQSLFCAGHVEPHDPNNRRAVDAYIMQRADETARRLPGVEPTLGSGELVATEEGKRWWGWFLCVAGYDHAAGILNATCVATYLSDSRAVVLLRQRREAALFLLGGGKRSMASSLAVQKYDLIPAGVGDAVAKVDGLLARAREQIDMATAEGDVVSKGLVIASAMQAVRTMLPTEALELMSALEGSPLGFSSDVSTRGQKTELAVLRDCFIQASLVGARMVGGEVTIISRRPYLGRAFYERICRQVPGVTDLKVRETGVYKTDNPNVMRVSFRASWRQGGKLRRLDAEKTDEFDGRIRVTTKSNDKYQEGVEATVGKAARDFLKLVYEEMTGGRAPEIDDEEGNTITATATESDRDAVVEMEAESDTEQPVHGQTPALQSIRRLFDECDTPAKVFAVLRDIQADDDTSDQLYADAETLAHERIVDLKESEKVSKKRSRK